MTVDVEQHLPTIDRLAPFTVQVEPMSVAGYLYARDGAVPRMPEPGDAVPWSFFTLLRAQFRLGGSIHELMDRDPSRGLMVSIEYEGDDGCAVVGDLVDARCSLDQQRVVERDTGSLVLTTVRTTWTARDRGWRLEERTTMADLFGEHAMPARRSPQGAGGERRIGAIGRLRIAWCCVATEDLQDVHHETELAQQRGYDDVLVPGTLLAGIAERELRRDDPCHSLTRLTARFVAPTYPTDDLVWRRTEGDSYEIHRDGDAAEVVAVGGGRVS